MSDPQPVTYFSRLDADECWALLSEVDVGRVAWMSSAGIAIVPVNFRVTDRTVMFHTAPDSSLAQLAEGSEVAFQADDIDRESAVGWSVLVRGTSGPAEATDETISWLDDDRTLGVAITATSIDGRVVSGTRREQP